MPDALTTQSNIARLLSRFGLREPAAWFWRIIQHPERLVYGFEVAADYRAFRRRYGHTLSQGSELADPQRRVLILSFSNYVAQLKAESALAKALQLRGLTPVVVTSSRYRDALRYHRVFGIDQFIWFDRDPDVPLSAEARREVEVLTAGSLSIRMLKHFQYRGTRVGAHVLRTLTRSALTGSIDVTDPTILRRLRALLLEGMHNVEKAEVLLDRERPEVIFTLHPRNLGEGDIFEVAIQRGINTVHWDGAQKDDHWIFKRYTKATRDLQPFSLSNETWERAQQMTWDVSCEAALLRELQGRYDVSLRLDNRRLQEGKRILTKAEAQRRLGLDLQKKTGAIFSHITWDASFLHGTDLFDTYEAWLIETVRAACRNPAVNWIVKLHPANLMKLRGARFIGEASDVAAIRNEIGKLPPHVRLLPPDTEINTWSLFEVADYCLTVRGTIGIEMACFGIPVLTAGTGRYSGRGFTIDSSSQEEYLKRLARIQDIPPLNPSELELAKKHAYWLFLERPVRLEIAQKHWRSDLTTNKGHPLASNYTFRITSEEDLLKDDSLRRFARWVLESDESDYYSSWRPPTPQKSAMATAVTSLEASG